MARQRGPGSTGASRRPQLTHFLCIPLPNAASRSQLEAKLSQFRRETTDELPSKAIRPVGALHCTLGVMSLGKEELEAAVSTLKELDVSRMLRMSDGAEHTTTPAPLQIRLKGLESMHEPHSTSILYAAPQDTTDRLLSFCLSVQAVFKANDLLVQDERPLRLHTTIVNTIYAKGLAKRTANPQPDESSIAPDHLDGSTGHGKNAKGSSKFDATELLTKYKDYVWTELLTLDRIAICEMGAKKQYDDDGHLLGEEYKEVVHIALPR